MVEEAGFGVGEGVRSGEVGAVGAIVCGDGARGGGNEVSEKGESLVHIFLVNLMVQRHGLRRVGVARIVYRRFLPLHLSAPIKI